MSRIFSPQVCLMAGRGILITTLKHDLPWGGSFKKLKPVLQATTSGESRCRRKQKLRGRVLHPGWGHRTHGRGGVGGQPGDLFRAEPTQQIWRATPCIQTQNVSSPAYAVSSTVYMVHECPSKHPRCTHQRGRGLWSTQPVSLVLSSCWRGPVSHAP